MSQGDNKLHEKDMTGDGVDTKLSLDMINRQMKEQFKNHNPELGD